MAPTRTPKDSPLRVAEATYTKATKAELDKDWDKAFQSYINAAEGFLHMSRTVTNERLQSTCKSLAAKALERAEKIKGIQRDLTPVTVDIFSEKEQFYILKKSSLVNGLYYPLWDETSPEFSDGLQGVPDSQPELSPAQSRGSAEWRRPADVNPKALMISPLLLPHDIIQLIVDDCSVCSSISVCLQHHMRFGSQLGLSALHPRGSDFFPRLSENGQYSLRVFFNGAHRRIVIDDKLPFDPDGTLMCVSTGSKNQLWPSFIEKAYMKLMGGYNFPGSNSCIDLHTLAGWIPDHIEMQSSLFEREKSWRRVYEAFSQGHCVLTVGTADKPDIQWNNNYFRASHCLAVIDVCETNGERYLTVLDSKAHHDSTDGEQLMSSEAYVLDIPWEDVCNVFESLYLSWNLALFKNHLAFHGMWKSDNANQPSTHCLQLNLKPSSSSLETAEIWVLLTRHVVDTSRNAEYISLRVDDQDNTAVVAQTIDIASKGRYTNSPHVLIRTQVTPSTRALSLFASYDGSSADTCFTVTAYSPTSVDVAWDKEVRQTPFIVKVEGTLSSKNAGGNPTHSTYMLNPQYHLRIQPEKTAIKQGTRNGKAHIVLTAQGQRDIPMNVAVVWSHGERIFEINQPVAADSGAYTYGMTRITADLPSGDFTVILSAFEPLHMGDFSLCVESTKRFDLKAIPQEGAGMYNKILRGTWDAATAGGGPSSRRYSSNPMYELGVSSPTQIIIRLQLIKYVPGALMNVTVFPAAGTLTSSLGRHVATSGPYSASISGVVTPCALLQPGKYLVLPSTFNAGILAQFRIIVYSSTIVSFTAGG